MTAGGANGEQAAMARQADDEIEPAKPVEAKKNLEVMSIEALTAYLDELAAEIERVRAMITLKERARTHADALFKL